LSYEGVDLNPVDVGSLSDDAAYSKQWMDILHLLKTDDELRAQMAKMDVNQNQEVT